MSVVLYQPHSDDAVLFASYQLLKHDPVIVTVFESHIQRIHGITNEERVAEDEAAFDELGVGWSGAYMERAYWLTLRDDAPDPDALYALIGEHATEFTHAIAPAFEANGHPQHNMVAEAVATVFGQERSTWYFTYKLGCGRTHLAAHEVEPAAGWRSAKMRAMGRYTSQIDLHLTRPWFQADDALREWTLEPARD